MTQSYPKLLTIIKHYDYNISILLSTPKYFIKEKYQKPIETEWRIAEIVYALAQLNELIIIITNQKYSLYKIFTETFPNFICYVELIE